MIAKSIPETVIPIYLLLKLLGIRFLNNDSSTILDASDSTIVLIITLLLIINCPLFISIVINGINMNI